MRAGTLFAGALCLLALPAPAPALAQGARLVTWDDQEVRDSRFVDPAKASPGHYNEPPGVPERENALRVNVYLPRGFDRDRRWPVLYLLHGQGDAFDSWAHPDRGDVLATAAGFAGIIVMPEADRGFYTNWWNAGAVGDPAWERYHLDELIPLVEDRLPIRRKRRWHAVAGLSMGGLGAMFYASQRPGYFGSAASFSGALSIQRPTFQQGFPATGQDSEPIWGDEREQEFYWRGHNPVELVENLARTRLFVSAGNGVADPSDPDQVDNFFGQVAEAELGQQAAEFAAAAEDAGADVTYRPHQGIHDWPYWRADLADAVEWGFFEKRRSGDRRGPRLYETVAKVGEMWGLRFRFSAQPTEVIAFARSSRLLEGEGSGKVTVRTRAGCKLVAKLPFRRKLPRPPC